MKHRFLAVLLGLILLSGCICAVRAENQLPDEIRGALTGLEITGSAYWDNPGSTWFVLVRTPDGTNMLVCFVLSNGAWVQAFHTAAAIPQGDGRVRIHFTDKSISFSEPSHSRTGPILLIMQYGTGLYKNSVKVHTSFLRSDTGIWECFHAFFQDEQSSLYYYEDSISFHTPLDQDHDEVHTVKGDFERDLRTLDFNSIPRTWEQAAEKLNSLRSRSGNETQP